MRFNGAGIVLVFFLGMFVYSPSVLAAGDVKSLKPSSRDKCPVCGMFVAKYPDWLAQISFKDGTTFFFDGPKDMLKFYFNLNRYSPKHKADDIGSAYVTDYYSLLPIDGFSALYVIGSDVYGPMGRELIPFGKSQEATEFMRDHKGREILKFQNITPPIVKGLD
jgi:copper chaperone NosL